MSTPSKLQGKQKRYNETKNPFLALPLKDQKYHSESLKGATQ